MLLCKGVDRMKHAHIFPYARLVRIPSQGTSIALTVLENHPHAVTVLFYAGTMASPTMYTLLLHELHRLGCNVVGIHTMSHGESPKEKKLFTLSDLVQNGKDAHSWARKHFSGPIVVSGHSQGGILALAHALNAPSQGELQVDAIFPIGLLLPHKDDAIFITRLASLHAYKKPFLALLRFFDGFIPFLPIPFIAYLQIQRVLKNAYKVYIPRQGNRLSYPLRFISSLFHADFSQAEIAGHIHCPLILLTAKNDVLFPLSLMEKTLGSIQAPSKKCIVIDGGGHLCATSRIYAKHIAAHIAAHCAGLGFSLHTTQKDFRTCNTKV